jgi:hypothetical protein
MIMVQKEQHLNMRMEHIRFGKEELERRRKSPVHTNRPCMESTARSIRSKGAGDYDQDS